MIPAPRPRPAPTPAAPTIRSLQQTLRRRARCGPRPRPLGDGSPRTGTYLDCPSSDERLDFLFAPMLRVLLVYTGWRDDDDPTVARRVRIAVPDVPAERAREVVRQARVAGATAILWTAPPEEAEAAVLRLGQQGLRATIMEA